MPRTRLSMRQVHEVLRLKWAVGLSNRHCSEPGPEPPHRGGVCAARPSGRLVLAPARRARCGHVGAAAVSRLPSHRSRHPPGPDWPTVHHELKRKGVTLFLLWQEYKAATPEGFQYSWFCQAYRAWASKLNLVMRQSHRAGESSLSTRPAHNIRAKTIANVLHA